MTKEEKKQYSKLASFGCILCFTQGYVGTPAEIHHIRRFGMKRDQAPAIPLCPEHHRGQTGIHGLGRKRFEQTYNTTEEDLLAIILSKLA